MELFLLQPREIFRAQPPAKVYAAAHHSRIAAWCVEENPIKWGNRRGVRQWFAASPVILRASGNLDAKTFQIILQRSDSALVTVASDDHALVFHQLGEVPGFPAGCCAC